MEMKGINDETERLFIAVPLPRELQGIVGEQCGRLSRKLQFAKWTHPQDYHITLQFMGDIPIRNIPPLLEALQEAEKGMKPFKLSLHTWGIFGLPEAPRVLWAGISGELDKLEELHRSVTNTTRLLGYSNEARPYKPHLTLARKYRDPEPFTAARLADTLGSGADSALPGGGEDWTVDRFVVYATRMNAVPMYEMIENMTFF
ncbi:RNA 2',3'-cyclic phosphodiesterase [Paenibacillus donghaensis]|uniref:RNA 2',3'-cyclic phosphodiesterase n=1 Tax=Paenibacillus donghaensis TaxID=414771 RepID=A0A2Z2KNK8_9BACL|nr:RNA 2',3'-cyclic phosphodiesterase [Paenibacillus donghaensis]ASA26055.1 RNA 2',3'-cyclic phosphodiesterase [Paenibacillus donghaensis]